MQTWILLNKGHLFIPINNTYLIMYAFDTQSQLAGFYITPDFSNIFHSFSIHFYRSVYEYTWKQSKFVGLWLIVLGFNDTSTLQGHFLSSPREREKRDRRESRGDEREGQGRKRNRNESEETEEIKTFPLYPYPLQG